MWHSKYRSINVCDYIKKLCRQQVEATQNHESATVDNVGQGETRRKNIMSLNLTAVSLINNEVVL
jgi:hypothetical protein